MLRNLLESDARPQLRRAGGVVSVVIHTCIIGVAAEATAGGREPPASRVEAITDIVFIPPVPPVGPTPAPATPSRRSVGPEPIIDRVPDVPIVFRPELSKIPTGLPDPSAALARPGDPELPGSRTIGVLPGSHIVTDSPTPYTDATVEKSARLLTVVAPRYPERLRAAGISGRVVARFVIDTTGRVEPTTVTMLESDHEAMADAVRGVLPKLRFDPAEVGGRRVRMLAVMPFEFSLR